MKKYLILLFLIYCFGLTILKAKDSSIDSLKTILQKTYILDTNRVNTLSNLSWKLYLTNPDTTIILCKEALEISKKIGFKKGQSDAYAWLGYLLQQNGNFSEAIHYMRESLKLYEDMNNKKEIGVAYNNIAYVYQLQKYYDESSIYYQKAIAIRKQIKDTVGLAYTYNNLGMVYIELNQIEKAYSFFRDASYLFNLSNDKRGLALAINNIGLIHDKRSNYDSTMYYYKKVLSLRTAISDFNGLSDIYFNLGSQFFAISKNMDSAMFYADLAIKNAEIVNSSDNLKSAYLLKSRILEKIGNTSESFEYFKLYTSLKDSLFNNEKSKEFGRMEVQYEYEKQKGLDDKENEKRIAIEKEKQKKQFIILILSISGSAIVIILLLIIYRRLQITRKQKIIIEEQKEEVETQRDEIERQKHIVEEKHTEIQESIRYAKRIQEAILPSFESIQRSIKNGFVLYQPKDVVAGDFYWLEEHNNKIYIAAADCTGHGVPGAMVSVICSNALTKSLKEEGKEKVSEILDKTREIVVSRLSKSGGSMKDGMDISLACFDFESMKMEWAGANNPLYILRGTTEESQIEIIKGDKEPIGYTDKPTPFTNHSLELTKGDTIYLFTDGYADQFGGTEGKKLGYAKFREKLIEISNQEMETQKQQLSTYFKEWKGTEEQIDDVCVIGIKI